MALQRYGSIPVPGTTGHYVQVNADGAPRWGAIGYNIAWDLVPAKTAAGLVDVDKTPFVVGDRVIPFGTVMVKITGGTWAGYYAPYSTDTDLIAAGAGINATARGTTGIMNVTVKETDKGADLTGLLVGGRCWKERIKAGTTGLPSFANLEAALPLLEYVKA